MKGGGNDYTPLRFAEGNLSSEDGILALTGRHMDGDVVAKGPKRPKAAAPH